MVSGLTKDHGLSSVVSALAEKKIKEKKKVLLCSLSDSASSLSWKEKSYEKSICKNLLVQIPIFFPVVLS